MNNLHRDIHPGEVVIMASEYTDRLDRRFRCEDGSGLRAASRGAAVFGSWVIDPEPQRTRLEGYMIDSSSDGPAY